MELRVRNQFVTKQGNSFFFPLRFGFRLFHFDIFSLKRKNPAQNIQCFFLDEYKVM